jgi:hypothetical protein
MLQISSPQRVVVDDPQNKTQCLPLNGITLGQHESDNNNLMIQLTDVFCALFILIGPAKFDQNKRLILLFMNPLSGGHCNTQFGGQYLNTLPLYSRF